MKKALITLLFLILLITFMYKKEQSTLVFNESDITYDNNSYDFYEISFEKVNITTEDIKRIFDNFKIISIHPYIPKVYQSKLENKLGYYDFIYNDIDKNINKFVESYNKLLKNNGINDYYGNGIRLLKIKVYAKYNEVKDIINRNNKMLIL